MIWQKSKVFIGANNRLCLILPKLIYQKKRLCRAFTEWLWGTLTVVEVGIPDGLLLIPKMSFTLRFLRNNITQAPLLGFNIWYIRESSAYKWKAILCFLNVDPRGGMFNANWIGPEFIMSERLFQKGSNQCCKAGSLVTED